MWRGSVVAAGGTELRPSEQSRRGAISASRWFRSAMVAAALGCAAMLASNPARAACDMTTAGIVTCSGNFPTFAVTNTNGLNSSSLHAIQQFNNGSPIDATNTGVISGMGLGLYEQSSAPATVTIDNSGSINSSQTSSAIDIQGALDLRGNGGLVTYKGNGTVTQSTGGPGSALHVSNTGLGGVVITNSGTISALSGSAVDVRVQNGDILLNGSGELRGTNGVGASVVASGTGNVTVIGTGPITGGRGAGVNATSKGGNVKVATGNTITGLSIGVDAETTGSGTVDVITGGAITGSTTSAFPASYGIYTTAVDGKTTVSVRHDVTATDRGVVSQAFGNGSIEVDHTGGTISATADIAIKAIVTSASGTGSVKVSQSGGTLDGANTAVLATTPGSGDVTVDLNGGTVLATSADVVQAASTSGKTSVTAATALSSTGGNGIAAASSSGDIEITTSADVTGKLAAVDAKSTGGGNITLHNSATLAGDSHAINGSTSGSFAIDNDGTVSGLVSALNSDVSTSLFDNTNGIWNASAGASSFSGSMANGNAINMADGADILVAGKTTNSGDINFLGAGSYKTVGAFANDAGALNMANGHAGNVTQVGGSYTGTAGSTMTVDVNLATGAADRLNIAGGASGSTAVQFNVLQHAFIAGEVVIVDSGTGGPADAFFAGAPISGFGLIAYDFGQSSNDATNWVITSRIDDVKGASVLTNVEGTVATIASNFYQPVSTFVGGKKLPGTNAISYELWTHADAARLDMSSTGYVSGLGAALQSFVSPQEVQYQGLQVGADVGIHNVEGSGWSMHFGITGALLSGDIDQRAAPGSTDFDIPAIGAYTFATNGALTVEATVRHDFQQFKFKNAAGADSRNVDGSATTLDAVAVYNIGLGGGVLLSPAASINWSKSDLDDFAVAGGRVATGSDDALIGRFGAQLSVEQRVSSTLRIKPFAGASYWRNFESTTDLTYLADDPTGGVVPIGVATAGVDEFWQFSGGISGYDTALGVSGYVRGAWNEGSDISGYEFTAGGQINLN